MTRYQMLDNIRAHSVMVARVAWYLAGRLNAGGAQLNSDVVLAAALLHDIGKTACLRDGGNHAALGRTICQEHGYHELADIVNEHVVLLLGVPIGQVGEKELVYYADKRVTHDQIVSLDERLDYILSTYGNGEAARHQAIRENFAVCCQIEKRIWDDLSDEPDSLAPAVMSRPVPFAQSEWEYS